MSASELCNIQHKGTSIISRSRDDLNFLIMLKSVELSFRQASEEIATLQS